uniref:Uncharacterized protein n=1 Tax=Rhizophora mucronata TaxID=61149 RepID=A0A2P2QKV1_RHIMU
MTIHFPPLYVWVFYLLKPQKLSGDLVPLYKYFFSDPRDL